VVKIGRPEAFELPEMQELFQRAFKGDNLPDAEGALKWCREYVKEWSTGIFVAARGHEFVGLAIIDWNPSAFMQAPVGLFA